MDETFSYIALNAPHAENMKAAKENAEISVPEKNVGRKNLKKKLQILEKNDLKI